MTASWRSGTCSATGTVGIAQMFQVIEYARMMVDVKAIAATDNALIDLDEAAF